MVETATMRRIVIASDNPVKRRAVEGAVARMLPSEPFRVDPCAVASGVAEQPASEAETLAGAEGRAAAAAAEIPDAELWIGVEGGVEDRPEGLAAFAWVVVRSNDRVGRARSATFFLPESVAELVRSGVELGEADDRVFARTGSKRREGAVGLLTDGALDRRGLYEQAVLLALVPFAKPELYPPEAPSASGS